MSTIMPRADHPLRLTLLLDKSSLSSMSADESPRRAQAADQASRMLAKQAKAWMKALSHNGDRASSERVGCEEEGNGKGGWLSSW